MLDQQSPNGHRPEPTPYQLAAMAYERKLDQIQADTNFVSNLVQNSHRGGYRMAVAEASIILSNLKSWIQVQKDKAGPAPKEEDYTNLVIPIGGIIS